jgi:hypothetical protein
MPRYCKMKNIAVNCNKEREIEGNTESNRRIGGGWRTRTERKITNAA